MRRAIPGCLLTLAVTLTACDDAFVPPPAASTAASAAAPPAAASTATAEPPAPPHASTDTSTLDRVVARLALIDAHLGKRAALPACKNLEGAVVATSDEELVRVGAQRARVPADVRKLKPMGYYSLGLFGTLWNGANDPTLADKHAQVATLTHLAVFHTDQHVAPKPRGATFTPGSMTATITVFDFVTGAPVCRFRASATSDTDAKVPVEVAGLRVDEAVRKRQLDALLGRKLRSEAERALQKASGAKFDRID